MLVTCEKCQSKFNLDDDLVKESGTKVRCSNCQDIFTVYSPAPVEEVSQDLDLEEKAEAAEVSDELTEEEPLDFDLFESEEDQEDEDLSLEDFGLEEETASDGEETGSSEDLVEGAEEITPEELGFGAGDELPQTEETLEDDPAAEESEQEDLLLEGLDLDEEPSVADIPPSMDEDVTGDTTVEDEISFDDLALEEEPMVEDGTELDEQQDADGPEAEDGLSFEDLDLEEEAVGEDIAGTEMESSVEPEEALTFEEVDLEKEISEKDSSEELVAEVQPTEDLEDTEDTFPEGVVASLEEGDELAQEVPEDMTEEMPPASMIDKPAAKKGISMPLMICLVVVLVGGGAYAAFNFLKTDTLKLPFLESLAGPGNEESEDPGNLKITLLDDGITGGFVDNKSAGRIFVIKGKVKSGYEDARNFIRLKGVLYFKDGKVAKDGIVYCGNVLSETELQTLGMDAITKKLSNRFGNQKANFRVPSGKELPFMVVFNQLPENLGEFSVEVVDSIPG